MPSPRSAWPASSGSSTASACRPTSSGDEVRLFSRGLNDITAGLPGVVDLVRRVPVKSVVLDGEALGIDEDGQPLIFQDTMSGLATTGAYFFDVLHLDDASLIDDPLREPAVGVGDAAARRVEAAVDRHRRRRRGRGLRRQRRCHRPRGCDGQGDRVDATRPAGGAQGGARSSRCTPSTSSCWPPSGATAGASAGSATCTSGPVAADGFVMVGKTFKGMTDELLRWQTEELQRMAIATEGHTVHVRPELVVEIALDGVQRSTRYPGGVALRFARVRRYRPDKTAAGGRHDRASARDARRRSLRVWSQAPWRPCASTSGRWAPARARWRCRSITTSPAVSCTGCC